MTLKQFGARLREAREKRGITQEELVEFLGKKTIAAISQYETGKRGMSAVDLPELAQALEVPITYFFQDVLSEDDLDTALLEWFHTLPDVESKRRVFRFIQDAAPHILGAAG